MCVCPSTITEINTVNSFSIYSIQMYNLIGSLTSILNWDDIAALLTNILYYIIKIDIVQLQLQKWPIVLAKAYLSYLASWL